MTDMKLKPCPVMVEVSECPTESGITGRALDDLCIECPNRRATDAERFVELASKRIMEGYAILMTPTNTGVLVTGFRKTYIGATVSECAAKIAQEIDQ